MQHMRYAFVLAGICVAYTSVPAAAAGISEKYLPDDSEVVYGFNLRGILTAEIMKKDGVDLIRRLLAKSNVGAWMDLFAIQDLDEVESLTIAEANIKFNKMTGVQTYESLMMLKGKFDREKITKAMLDLDKIKSSEYQKYRIYERKQGEEPPSYAAVLNDEFILVANKKELIETVIDKEKGTKKTELKIKEVASALSRADTKQSIWLASGMPGLIRDMFGNGPPDKPLHEHLRAMTLSVTFSKGMLFQCDMHCLAQDNVAEVKTILEKSKGDLERFVSGNKKYKDMWADVFKNIRVSSKRDVVTVRMDLSVELASQFIEMYAENQ